MRIDVTALLQQGLNFHRAGRLAEAEAIYRQILSTDPERFDVLIMSAFVYFQRADYEGAIRQIDRALKLRPDSAEAAFNRGLALHKLSRFHDAVASYDRAIRLKPDYAEAFYNRAHALTELNHLDDALASFDRAVALRPDSADAFNNRGNTLIMLKRLDEAVASYDRAITLRADYAEASYNRGRALNDLERLDEALASFNRALALKPGYADAFNSRGNTLAKLKRLDEAVASYDKAVALKSNYDEAFYNRGIALHELGRFDEALASYDRAIALKPDYVEAFNNRGNVLQNLKRLDEAVASYDKAVALKSNYDEAFYNRGIALHELGRFDEALASYDRAIALKPDYVEAFNNRGNVLQELKRSDEALASYGKAIALRPDYADAFNNRGNMLHELNRFEEALASFDAALAIRPDFAGAYYNRGATLRDLGLVEESGASYAKALALKPGLAPARFGLCMSELPVLYVDERDITTRRKAYEQRLKKLCNALEPSVNKADLATGVGLSQPFYLAYQGYNDRDLQALYGSFVCRIMAERYPPFVPAPPPAVGEPVRVGIISGFFRNHSNWKLPIKGWLTQLDRRQFRIFCYHTDAHKDDATKAAAAMCDRFVQGPLPLARWRAEILADAPHVLIYPEIGMDAVAVALAAQRLAAVQCNSWGHPETSGLPTLDYYLSSDLMEPPDGEHHYTERLVRLPNLSVYCEPVEPPPVPMARRGLGLRASATAYWCGQSLFKYLPQFDEVYPRIARAAGDCQFVFIEHMKSRRITELFRRRLDRAFAAHGLRADAYCVFLPRLDQQTFIAATGQCDIFLDSIGWSGCNSTLESLCHDLPIVTMAGPLMRGRHGMAILNRMGVTETIVETIEDYVASAVRLARDVPWRNAVKAKIAAGKHRIYYDNACISALEQFLNRVGRRIAAE